MVALEDAVWVTSDTMNTLTLAVGDGAIWVGMRHEDTVWHINPQDPAKTNP
jgi:hypothetical protein